VTLFLQTPHVKCKQHVLIVGDEGKVCNDECSDAGCWSAKDDQCLSCRHVHLGKRCLRSCDDVTAVYQYSPTECLACHLECMNRCNTSVSRDILRETRGHSRITEFHSLFISRQNSRFTEFHSSIISRHFNASGG